MNEGTRHDATLSVVIPTHNGSKTIGNQLAALAPQLGPNMELLVVDNASTDDTVSQVESWHELLPNLRIITARGRQSVAYARNVGTAAACHHEIAYCDSDDVVGPNWVKGMAGALARHDLTTGPVDLAVLNPVAVYSWRKRSGWGPLPRWHRFLPCALGCNLGTTRAAFEALEGFDEALASSEDFDYVWRWQVRGGQLNFEPSAVVHWRVDPAPASYWRHHRAYGIEEPLLYKRFREAGMPRSSVMRALVTYAWLLCRLDKPLSRSRRYEWLDEAGLRAGRLVGSARYRVLYL